MATRSTGVTDALCLDTVPLMVEALLTARGKRVCPCCVGHLAHVTSPRPVESSIKPGKTQNRRDTNPDPTGEGLTFRNRNFAVRSESGVPFAVGHFDEGELTVAMNTGTLCPHEKHINARTSKPELFSKRATMLNGHRCSSSAHVRRIT